MSQKLVRAFLVGIVVLFGTSVASAEKVIPKEERAKLAGIWGEDCANPKATYMDLVAGWAEIYPGGGMVTNKDGVRQFRSSGKRLYRANFTDVQSSGPGTLQIQTKTGTMSAALGSDGKLKVMVKDAGYEYAGNLSSCK